MADKSNSRPSAVSVKPVPMKLFAAWEVDKTTPNCIPRQCTFTLTRLLILKPLGSEVASITIAVKMQSSKRTLRSNDLLLPSSGLLDTELDLSFSLQYPHFLKAAAGGNKLHVTLQRRKRYKNRAMLGYKTIATGIINMSEVLQRPVGRELELLGEEKEKAEPVARIQVEALSTHPVEDPDHRLKGQGPDAERSADNTDEDDDSSSNEDGSDSEAAAEDGAATDAVMRRRRSSQMRKRNIKQKFIALLKKFRVPDAEGFGAEHYPEGLEQELMHKNSRDLEDLLFDELEELSDSGPEADDISVSSTPKPSLRPFFSSSTLVPLESEKSAGDKHSDDNPQKGESDSTQDTEQEEGSQPQPLQLHQQQGDDRRQLFKSRQGWSSGRSLPTPVATPKEPRSLPRDLDSSPRQSVLDQLVRLFPGEEAMPERLVLVESGQTLGQALVLALGQALPGVLPLATGPDLRAALATLVNKIQKFCNCNSRAPLTLRVGVVGTEPFVHSLVRLYVEHFSSKPQEWQAYVRFFLVPTGGSPLVKYLCSVDSVYGSQFGDPSWGELLERASVEGVCPPELSQRLLDYLGSAHACLQLPLAEAMVTYKGTSWDEESTQVFIPFISDVKIGVMEGAAASGEAEDSLPGGSPPSGGGHLEKAKESTTPPSSPSLPSTGVGTPSGSPEAMDLQLDYWTLGPRKGAESTKFTLKACFRTLQVWRLPSVSEAVGPCLLLSYVTKEKKQKIMRLGKKKERESERESRCQTVEGVHRLICSCRNLQPPLKVTIDSVEWTGVKFFQLSSQWQTHIKYFPVGLYIAPEHGTSH